MEQSRLSRADTSPHSFAEERYSMGANFRSTPRLQSAVDADFQPTPGGGCHAEQPRSLQLGSYSQARRSSQQGSTVPRSSSSSRLISTPANAGSAWFDREETPHSGRKTPAPPHSARFDRDRSPQPDLSEFPSRSDEDLRHSRSAATNRRSSCKESVPPWAHGFDNVDATRQGVDLALRVQVESKRQELLAAQAEAVRRERERASVVSTKK